MAEVPWFATPPEAMLRWPEGSTEGYLHFVDPEGNHAVVPVTHKPAHYAPTRNADGTPGTPRAMWCIKVSGEWATVTDSIHWVGHWHSPNPVTFKLVDHIDFFTEIAAT